MSILPLSAKVLHASPRFAFLAAALIFATVPLRAQEDTPSSPPQDAAAPMQDQAPAPAPDQAAAMQDQVTPDQAPAPTSDQPTGAVQDTASFQTFYDDLASQGSWVMDKDYGYIWQPTVTDPNWAPYTAGHWAYTDDGWTWVSDEQFGWATYHYGRWVNLDGVGWVWVPGYTWAPAWVSWRYGDGYAGWAPLPPDSMVGTDYSSGETDYDAGYHIGGDVDSYYGIGPAYYIFVPVNVLCYRDYRGHYCNRHDNFGLIGRTSNVTNINVGRDRGPAGLGHAAGSGGLPRSRVTVGGPQLAQVNAASQTPIQKLTLARATQPGGGAITGNSLALYAPHVTTGGTTQPPRLGAPLTQTRMNRGTDILKPLAVNSHIAPQPATEAQVQQARTAESHMPATAKVLVDADAVKPIRQSPLTAMQPVAAASPRPSKPTAGGITHGPGTMPGAAPSSVYAQPRGTSAPSYTPPQYSQQPSETRNNAPSSVYNNTQRQQVAPSTDNTPRVFPHAGSESAAPSRVYSPAPSGNPYYQPQPQQQIIQRTQQAPAVAPQPESRGYNRPSSATYNTPVAPSAPSAPVQRQSAPAPAPAPVQNAPAASSGGDRGGSSTSSSAPAASSGGAGSGPNSRNH